MQSLIDEMEKVKNQQYELDFTYPTRDEIEKLKKVHRDRDPADKQRFREVKLLLYALTLLEQG